MKSEKVIDYRKLGFRCGIECHQQLETRKLFCNCPSIINGRNPYFFVERKLRPVAGETGQVDAAAEHEKKKGLYIRYEACPESSCLVELDEEPPHQINHEAVEVAVRAAHMFKAKLVDEVQVMRKTVVDGSNPSGFQRTALVARDGHVETSLGRVGIPLICLEEEAAKKIKEDKGSVTYRIDRLGVALLEVSTSADIKSPEHARECAEKIGLILRSTGKAKRGIGTIRQDVNISIKDGARTEIKGFQDLRSIPSVIKNEVERQLELIRKGKKVEESVRKAKPDGKTTYLRPMPGAARMYPETDIAPFRPPAMEGFAAETIEQKAERFSREMGLSKDLANKIAKSVKCDLFEECVRVLPGLKAAFLAETIISAPREIRRKHGIDIEAGKNRVDDRDFIDVLRSIEKGEVAKDSILEVLMEFSKGNKSLEAFRTAGKEEIEKEILDIVAANPGKNLGALMGIAMSRLAGRADGKTVSEIIKKYLEK